MHIPDGPLWDWDRELLLRLNGSWGSGWDTFWWTITEMLPWMPMFALIVFLMYRRFGWRGMLVAVGLTVLAIGLADQMAGFFKTYTPKFRPSHTLLPWDDGVAFNEFVHTVRGKVGGSFGTVSGHAATSMAIAVTTAGIYRRWWFSLMLGLFVVIFSFSRIYLGLHFPLDILFGLCGGTLVGLLMLWLWRWINNRFPQILNPDNS